MKAEVTKEKVTIIDFGCINAGEVCVNECEFSLPDCFENLNVTAVFNNIPVPVADGRCVVPNLEKGSAFLGVYAYSETEEGVTLMYSPMPAAFFVNKGSYTDNIAVEDKPTITEYEQFCRGYMEILTKLLNEKMATKQDTLVSGENIKTVDGQDILGEGNIELDWENKFNSLLNEVTSDRVTEVTKEWLDDHPEIIENVPDGTFEIEKLTDTARAWIRSNVINVKDYGAVGDGVADDTAAIKNAFGKLTDYGVISFPKGHYLITPTANKQSLIALSGLKNITIDLNGSTIEVATNGYPNYYLFSLTDCENFTIKNGCLKGDRLTHDYTTTSGTHEFGYGIYCGSSLTYYSGYGTPSDTLRCSGVLSDLKIHDFTGDGIVTKNGMSPGKIEVLNCEIHHCRRQGVSILDTDAIVIENCHIHHIGNFDDVSGASPMSGIDIEPGSGTRNVNLVDIRNTVIEETSNESIVAVTKVTKTDGVITSIDTTIKEVLIDNCRMGTVNISAFGNADIENQANCRVVVKDTIIKHCDSYASGQRYLLIRDGLYLNCIFYAEADYTAHSDMFMGGTYNPTLKNCVLNLKDNTRLSYIILVDSTVNGGLLYRNETAASSVKNCSFCDFKNVTLQPSNVSGKYKFSHCDFENCSSTASASKMKFFNCSMDTRVMATANYQNCIIEDELV